MMARTHSLSGSVAYLAAVPWLATAGVDVSPTAVAVGAVAAAGGAMLPDMDHQSASIAHSLGPITGIGTRIVSRLFGGHRNGTHSLLGIAVFVAVTIGATALGGWWMAGWLAFLFAIGLDALNIVNRDGIAYTGAIAAGIVALTGTTVWAEFPLDTMPWAVGIGAAAHIAGDMLTPQRCPLLWLPIKVWPKVTRHRFGIGLVETDGPVEAVLVGGLLSVAAVWLVMDRTGNEDALWQVADLVRSLTVAAT